MDYTATETDSIPDAASMPGPSDEEALRARLRRAPGDVDALYLLGVAAFNRGDHTAAI